METWAIVAGLYAIGVGVGYLVYPFVSPPKPSQLHVLRERERVWTAALGWWILVPAALAFASIYAIALFIFGVLYVII